MRGKLKKVARILLNLDISDIQSDQNDYELILERITNHGISSFLDFSYDKLKAETLSYVDSMKIGNSGVEFRYSSSCKSPNIYSSAYACLINSMFGRLDEMTLDERQKWAGYFNKFQSKEDGLFYDESLLNEI